MYSVSFPGKIPISFICSSILWYILIYHIFLIFLKEFKGRALRIILGTDYISYANALDICDVRIVYLPGGSNIV